MGEEELQLLLDVVLEVESVKVSDVVLDLFLAQIRRRQG